MCSSDLAAAAAAAVLFAVSGTVSKNSTPTTNVVVAKTTIAAGTAITSDLLSTTPLAQGSFPVDTFTDPSQAVGKIAPVTLSANIPLTASLFASASSGAGGAGVVTHLDITKGYVAMAIPAGGTPGDPGLVAELMSVGYYIQPEDHIDILIDSGAGPDYTVVDTVQALGARQATEHLLRLGHGQVWHIAGPETAFSASRRAQSWARTLLEAGITAPPVLRGDWTSESGYQHGLTLGGRPDVTAIFAANDQMALGVMRALHELGRDIPGDVSVIGFDDMAEASSFWPPLTTNHQDFHAVGRLSIRKLLAKVSGASTENDKTSVPTELVVRSSTGPPPG